MWTINDSWRVRAGRMVTPIFMLSDSQNVGYSMVPVRYSREMGDNYPLSRHDGAEVIFGTELGPGRLQVQASRDVAIGQNPRHQLRGQQPGDLVPGRKPFQTGQQEIFADMVQQPGQMRRFGQEAVTAALCQPAAAKGTAAAVPRQPGQIGREQLSGRSRQHGNAELAQRIAGLLQTDSGERLLDPGHR